MWAPAEPAPSVVEGLTPAKRLNLAHAAGAEGNKYLVGTKLGACDQHGVQLRACSEHARRARAFAGGPPVRPRPYDGAILPFLAASRRKRISCGPTRGASIRSIVRAVKAQPRPSPIPFRGARFPTPYHAEAAGTERRSRRQGRSQALKRLPLLLFPGQERHETGVIADPVQVGIAVEQGETGKAVVGGRLQPTERFRGPAE